jgi:tetratricopeptide (TPR) repeat protein
VTFAGEGGIVGAVTKALHCVLAALAVTLAPATAAASPYRVLVQDAAPAGPASDGPLTNDPAVEYQKGEQAYALGNYESAVRHFERSYELSNLPDLLYNLGMSYQQWFGLSGDINHLRKAKRLFQNYVKRLAENPAMDQSQRAEAEGHIGKIDEQIAAEEARVKPVPPPVVDQQTPPTTQPPVDQPAKKPVYKRGWFWGVIGGIVAVGAVTAIAVVLTRDDAFKPELGTIRPSAAGVRF